MKSRITVKRRGEGPHRVLSGLTVTQDDAKAVVQSSGEQTYTRHGQRATVERLANYEHPCENTG